MELLSPAGNLECALAAFDGGADAVYGGLSRFNARERAENFTPETMGRLIRFAKENGKRVYVTLNTLLREEELPALFEELCELEKLSPHALIVQDFGVIRIARKYFPSLALHASTQMGIHNSAGVAAAAKLGIKRVILERQLTGEEIRLIAANSPVELEVFIHGSLCCSLSGRCLLSHALFGCSGNRGECKQPCRRRYSVNGHEARWALSPRDLRGSDLIPELRKWGIASLKIEGRLRSPDYVWKTARAYRILLEAAQSDFPEALHEAENILLSAVSRAPSHGFFDMGKGRTLIDEERSGAFGLPAGKVERALRRGLLISASSALHLGDRLRLTPPDGGDGESFSLIKMERSPGQPVLRAAAGMKVFLPGSYKAGDGWRLTKIGENGFDFSRRASTLPPLRYPVTLAVSLAADGIRCRIEGKSWEKSVSFPPAEKHPISSETVKRIFSENPPEPWQADVTAQVQGEIFVPAAALKALRREFWAAVAPELHPEEHFAFLAEKMEAFFQEYRAMSGSGQAVPEKRELFEIPAFLPEKELPVWREKIRRAVEAGEKEFAVSGVHAVELLAPYSGIRRHFRFPFPVGNSFAAALAASLGADSAQIEPELPAEAAELLLGHVALPLFRSAGDPPLLVTRLPLPEGEWSDEAGRRFFVRRHQGISALWAKKTPGKGDPGNSPFCQ